MSIKKLLSAFLGLSLMAGCGSSSGSGNPIGGAPVQTAQFVKQDIVGSTGGSIAHPASGHTANLSPGALSDDTTVTLTLISAGTLALRNQRDFQPVGQALRLDIGGASLLGEASFRLPYQTDRPQEHGVYWHLPEGLAIPLETTYDASNGTFLGRVDFSNEALLQSDGTRSRLNSESLTISVIDEGGYLSRPPHVNWPSYNLYVFTNGAFEKVVDQGSPIAAIPSPGNKPLMIVHGLGSNIPRFQTAAKYLDSQGPFTAIYGFEYDTLSGITTTGPRLNTAYSSLESNPNSQWSHLAHSMGTIVSRVAFENGTPPPYESNSVTFASGPHLGSSAVNALEGSLSTFQRFVRFVVVNEVLDFRNADGTPCQVDVDAPGFSDLAAGSAALAALNNQAAQNHPEETYRTLGGNEPGLEYDAADFILGVYPSDGLVDLSSANPGIVIGAVKSSVVPESHSSIVDDTTNSLPIILSDLLTPTP